MSAALVSPQIALVGCDFRVASSRWRGLAALAPDERLTLRESLASAAQARGLVVLDTCNRTEWIADSPQPEWAAELMRAWMVRRWKGRAPEGPVPEPYSLVGEAAARHFVGVAVGLESCVPGEREIAGQCRRALDAARADGSSSTLLEALGKSAARAVRRLERRGGFRREARGVQHVIVDTLEREIHAGDGPRRAGVIGWGALGQSVASLLEAGGWQVACFNRTPNASALPLSELPGRCGELDAVVACTSARQPIVELAALRGARLVVDAGIPAQVRPADPSDGLWPRLLGFDELVAAAARSSVTPAALADARNEVDAAVAELQAALRKGESAPLLQAVQRRGDQVRDHGLPKILDEHLADLDAARRRRLEAALRSLMSDHHRTLLEEIERETAPQRP